MEALDPLAGRARELAVLRDIWHRTLSGSGTLLLITGEVGAGRARLLEELAPAAIADGAQLLLGSVARDLTVAPNRFCIATPRRDTDSGTDQGVRRAAADREDPQSTSAGTLTARLLALAGRRPVLLVIDDLDQADAAALHTLAPLADAVRSSRLMIAGIATERSPDARGLDAALDETGIERLRVEPLDAAAVAQFAARVLTTPLRSRVVAELHSRTRGNALFVRELLRLIEAEGGFADEGRAVAALRDWPRVEDVIARRLGRLTDSGRHLLEVAATQDTEFDVGRLRELVGRETEQFLDRLDEVEHAAVVRPSPWTPGRYRFAHPLLRAAARYGHGRTGFARVRLPV